MQNRFENQTFKELIFNKKDFDDIMKYGQDYLFYCIEVWYEDYKKIYQNKEISFKKFFYNVLKYFNPEQLYKKYDKYRIFKEYRMKFYEIQDDICNENYFIKKMDNDIMNLIVSLDNIDENKDLRRFYIVKLQKMLKILDLMNEINNEKFEMR
jgi:hypothetical protein